MTYSYAANIAQVTPAGSGTTVAVNTPMLTQNFQVKWSGSRIRILAAIGSIGGSGPPNSTSVRLSTSNGSSFTLGTVNSASSATFEVFLAIGVSYNVIMAGNGATEVDLRHLVVQEVFPG